VSPMMMDWRDVGKGSAREFGSSQREAAGLSERLKKLRSRGR
jgi:hypothetical protein